LVAVQSAGLTSSDLLVELFDLQGRLVQTSKILQGSTIAYFDTRTLYQGEYIIRVTGDRHVSNTKLILTK
jgi:hypothetical protein